MNNNECNVARDLMPLLVDQVASEESRTLVEAHVADCVPCAQVYADMEAKVPEKMDTSEDNSFAAAMRQLRRTVGWHRMKVIVSSVVITLLLLAAGIWGNQFFLVEDRRDMPLDWYSMTLSRSKDGTGIVALDFMKGYNGGYWSRADISSGILVLGSNCPLILPIPDESHKMPGYIEQPGILWKDGIGFVFAGDDSKENTTDIAVKEIRMGSMENYKILYQQGDDVPLCSDKLETIVQLERKHDDVQKAADNVLNDLEALYDSTVP
jgi:hypothetical protein